MIRLGDIEYSNGFPVHAHLIDEGPPPGVVLVRGTPGELNAQLAAGLIDVAPCSSIEFARHAEEYALLPDLAIGSDGAVGSIVLESTVPPAELGGRTVAVPTASATSVVLLRALLEERAGIRPVYRWFDQKHTDPLAEGTAAALWIGDVALRRPALPERVRLDLGQAWTEWTGLPFVYALWQGRRDPAVRAGLARLHDTLLASRAWFETHAERLAGRYAARFEMPADRLLRYWRSLRYDLDERLLQGLDRFWTLAVRLGEAPAVPEPLWITHDSGSPPGAGVGG